MPWADTTGAVFVAAGEMCCLGCAVLDQLYQHCGEVDMSRMQSRRQETASVEQSRDDRTARERAYPVSALPTIAPTNPGTRRVWG